MTGRERPEECIEMLSGDSGCKDGLRASKKSHPHEYGWLDRFCRLVRLLSRLLPQSPVLAQKADGTDSGSFTTLVYVTCARCKMTGSARFLGGYSPRN